ncbi:hypothetical protein [Mycobacteroides abscessus]|uniref:hypothetical protein n=1 Tax=Mycobacteroides abscessus TaxID=36809 RepID=UPI00266DA219|nr:hypothetical protein [Mycobacteroides abscessus]MDO3042068.1 hypothetical protein [Mycobacteroides abscessus subsp. abscessus]MDO3111501.1 hypothetical protein [Mycobacteroides abscessus subsp. massiliense]
MSEDEMNGQGSDTGPDFDSVIRQALEDQRRKLEQIAAETARVKEIDRQAEALKAERQEAMARLQELHADLTSGRSAGEALDALGVTSLAGVNSTGARQPAKATKKAPSKKAPPKPPKDTAKSPANGIGTGAPTRAPGGVAGDPPSGQSAELTGAAAGA